MLWLVLPGCEAAPPKIKPVAPLTVADAQPVGRETKQQILSENEGFREVALASMLLQWSIERTDVSIDVVYVRPAENQLLSEAESDAVRPALDLWGKFAGVRFNHLQAKTEQPPFARPTLIATYTSDDAFYHGAPVSGNAIDVTFQLYDTAATQPVSELNVGGAPLQSIEVDPKNIESAQGILRGSTLQALQNNLAEMLCLPQLSGRRYPLDPMREAQHQAIKDWERTQKQSK